MNSSNLHIALLSALVLLGSFAGAVFISSFLSRRFQSVAYLTDLLGQQYGFVRTKYEVNYKIETNGSMRSNTIEAIRAVNQDVYGIEHYSQVFTNDKKGVEAFSVKTVSAETNPAGVQVTPKLTFATPERLNYQLIYSPPLKPTQDIEYSYEVAGPPGVFAISVDELFSRKLPYDYISMKIAYPTQRFVMTVALPEELEVDDLTYDVWLGDARLRLNKEYGRLKKEGCLNVERLDDRQVVRLAVNYPILDVKYVLTWRPTKRQTVS